MWTKVEAIEANIMKESAHALPLRKTMRKKLKEDKKGQGSETL